MLTPPFFFFKFNTAIKHYSALKLYMFLKEKHFSDFIFKESLT